MKTISPKTHPFSLVWLIPACVIFSLFTATLPAAPLTIATTEKPSEKEPFILRINSGGEQLNFNNELFLIDQYFTGNGKVFVNKNISNIGNTNRDQLYLTERSTLDAKNSFNYAIPVPNGEYQVILHFAEIYWGATTGGAGGAGRRVFNVAIENKEFVKNLDLYKEVGSMNALQKEYAVTVTDKMLNLNFKGSKDQPKVSAIEIIEKRKPTAAEAFYINTGGPAVEVNGKQFVADSYYNGGRSFTNYGIPDIKDTAEDIIYKSERSTGTGSGGFSYNVPVTNGNYQVKVHLAEIYWGATGGGPGGAGKRLINLSLEGKKGLAALDIFKEVGSETALVKTFNVKVNDGMLNLDFTASKNEPKIAAIEINKKSVDKKETVIKRINAGSSAMTVDGKNFEADTFFTGNTSVFQNQKIADIKNTTEDALYKTERSAGKDKGGFGYAIPVEDGNYKVALHFAEIYWGATGGSAGGENKRRFSVALENNRVLTDFDMIKEVGTMTAAVKTYSTTVNDGLLNIDFTATVNRPTIAAIEVFKESEPPVDELPLIASFNTGGPEVALEGITFQADAYSRGSSKTGGTTFKEIKNTTIDAIYKTERSADDDKGSFSYDFPVTNGTYQVKLHFAEIWFGSPKGGPNAAGKRVFDVAFEGQTELSNLDLIKEVGSGAALVKTYEVSVSDGELNIDFSASADRPQLCAIQLYGKGELGEEGSTCQWKDLAPSGLEKLEAQSAKVGNKLYSFAGFLNGFIITGATEIYDVKNDIWSYGAPMPTPLTHMARVVINDEVWLIGGFIGDDPGVATDKVQIYNTRTDKWRAGPALPAPRGSGAAAYNDGKIHFFGGLLPDRVTDVSEHYILYPENPAAGWVPAAPLPFGRNHLSGTSLNGLVYAIGGQFGHDNGVEYLSYLHVYDPQTDTWTRKADLPSDRSHFEPNTIVHNNKIIIIGGRRGFFFFDDITEYDPATDRWTERCKLPEPLLAPIAEIFDDQLIVANGGRTESDLRNKTRSLQVEAEKTLSSQEEENLSSNSKFEKNITVFPNPTSGNLNIKGITAAGEDILVHVKNVNGANIMTKNFDGATTNYTLETSVLQSGLYFVEIISGKNARKVIKFIKN